MCVHIGDNGVGTSEIVSREAMTALRRSVLQIFNYWNQRCPFLWVCVSNRLHEHQLIGHHGLVIALTQALVARRKRRPQHLTGVDQSQEFLVDLTGHFRASIRSNNVGNDPGSENAFNESTREAPRLEVREWFQHQHTQLSAYVA